MNRISQVVILVLALIPSLLFARSNPSNWDGTRGPDMTEYFIKQHAFRLERGQIPQARDAGAPRITQKGNIVIMQSDARNFITLNNFDLENKKITFSRNPQGGLDLKVTAVSLGPASGTDIVLADDDFKQVSFTGGFSFPFFGATYNSVFVNSDGNLTFTKGDKEISARDVFRMVSGPPRVSPFFQDMNPTAGGSIKVQQSSTKFTVTWEGVSQYLQSGKNSNTFQINLFKNGTIEIVFGNKMDTKDAIVGLSSGNSKVANTRLVNYSEQTSLTGLKSTTIMESFASRQQIDWTGLIQEFHEVYPPIYDFMVVYSDFPQDLGNGAYAFFSHIKNDTKGIGLPPINFTKYFNTKQLQGFLAMGWLGKYPDDPAREYFGTNSLLEIMGQENGHRWLAFTHATINGVDSTDLLGRDEQHWSFYMDTDASVMEGNDIRDNGDGTFTTVQSTETYSKLDRYLMGFVPPGSVPPFFFVSGNSDKERPPETGVTFRGTRVDVTVQQVIQANGARVPASAQAQKKFKEAFILFTRSTNVQQKDLDKIEKIRTAWTAFFHQQTGNIGTLDTTVQPPH